MDQLILFNCIKSSKKGIILKPEKRFSDEAFSGFFRDNSLSKIKPRKTKRAL
jgi:hypothetical protein